MSEFMVQSTDAGLASIGASRGLERLAQIAERQDDRPYDVELEEGRGCLMCEGKGTVGNWYSAGRKGTYTCPHCHGRGWLKAQSYESQPLFSIKEMAVVSAPAWGVRHDESGFWWPRRLASRERAEQVRDLLTLDWCEGSECVLAERFATLPEEVSHGPS